MAAYRPENRLRHRRQLEAAIGELVRSGRYLTRDSLSKMASDVCVSLVGATEPRGFGYAAQRKGQKAIRGDIQRAVRALRWDTVNWYKSRGIELKSGMSFRWTSFKEVALHASRAKIEEYHQAARYRGKVRYGRGYAETLTTSAEAREVYICEKEKLAGLAKASWLSGMDALSKSRYHPPKWLRRGEAGFARRVEWGNASTFSVSVQNEISYMDFLLGGGKIQRAVRLGYFGQVDTWRRQSAAIVKKFNR